jgi:hypothetical protein
MCVARKMGSDLIYFAQCVRLPDAETGMRSDYICARETGSRETGSREMGSREMGSREMGSDRICAQLAQCVRSPDTEVGCDYVSQHRVFGGAS